ncbi:alpha-(1,3)-fucosyltransferase C-like isoform X1 [Spodoptera litura]|uniref:Fucosyltransferase n=1 Tax=Spodoptera litura TaxID=69820 RepID=A0A9J7EN86_SPOLT|nr:alpha-(1,3)-fucosyltransferase C-like isoform X1 [Spodoptera litura]
MRAWCTKKAIFFIAVMIILLLLYNAAKTVKDSHQIISNHERVSSRKSVVELQTVVNSEVRGNVTSKDNIKYILQWTLPHNVPFVYMGKGREGFISRGCPFTNCFVTSDRNYLGDYTKFDVIAFAGPEVVRYNKNQLPQNRSPHQKYAFASIESSDNYPTCSNLLNGFFNWTWTYKLDSEIRWGYMVIRDKNKNIVGPNKEMHWLKLEDMEPVSEDLKQNLRTKTKAAAWFVSNCYSRSRRSTVAKKLDEELQNKYNLSVDVFGSCGQYSCSRDNDENCDNLIKKDYYFYLSFENSFSEDYVTEKLVRALNFNAVPIVYGGANYTRFMPDGIYLDARKMSIEELAAKMNELINDPEKYAEYFKWKNHYTYHGQHESVHTLPYCLFCTQLNNEEMVKNTTIYKDFKNWWTPPGRC